MLEFFKWCATLSSDQAWLLFALVAATMFIVPFLGLFKRIITIVFSKEKTGIVDFSWRIAPAHLIHQTEANKYYYLSQNGAVLVGCPIILSWQVKGAYRIDIDPGFSSLKENSLIAIVKPRNNTFTLTAHTLNGKIQRTIQIADEQVKQIKTSTLGGANAFDQPEKKLLTRKLSKEHFQGKNHLKSNFKTSLNQLVYSLKRFDTQNRRMHYVAQNTARKSAVSAFINDQKMVKINTFKPSKFNQVLQPTNQNKNPIP
jgi:hypothetical protein